MFEVFESVSIWQLAGNDYMFMGTPSTKPVPVAGIFRRFDVRGVREDLFRIGVSHVGQLLGSFITADEPLRQWAAGAPLHTDDNALLEFSAPWSMRHYENVAIAGNLYGRQATVFESRVQAATDEGLFESVAARTAETVQARMLRAAALVSRKRGDFPAALNHLLQAFESAPSDPLVHATLREFRSPGPAPPADAFAESSQRLTTEMLAHLPTLMTAPVRGLSLDEITSDLQALARAQAKQGSWDLATFYLRPAYDATPKDGAITLKYAEALLRANDPAEAVRVLREAAGASTISLSQIEAMLARVPPAQRDPVEGLVIP
jgi:tetratricopeptide (TPR) repeat protein